MDTKISALGAGTPAQKTDQLPAARAAANVKLTVQDILEAIHALDAVTPALTTDELLLNRAGVGKKATLADVIALASGGGSAGHNFLINGSFDVAQRAASYAATTGAAYGCVDRWYMKQATTAQVTFSQAAPSPALPGWPNCLKVLLTGTSTGQIEWGEIIESIDVSPFQGQTVVLSFEAVKGSTWNPANLGVLVTTGTGADQGLASLIAATWTGQANTLNTTKAPAAAWGQFSATVAIPNGCTEIAVRFTATPTGAAVDANSYLMMTGADLRVGTSAPTSRDSRPAEVELGLCERFYQVIGKGCNGAWISTTQCEIGVNFRTVMRAAPTVAMLSSAPEVLDPGVALRTGAAATVTQANNANTSRGAVLLLAGFTGAVLGHVAMMDGDYMSATSEL